MLKWLEEIYSPLIFLLAIKLYVNYFIKKQAEQIGETHLLVIFILYWYYYLYLLTIIII